MVANGVDVWTSSLLATRNRASPSHSQASDLAKTMNDTYGPTLLASLAKSNRHMYFSKTCQATSLWDSSRSQQDLSEWATTLRRVCLRRRKLVRHISGNGCLSSAWQTATGSMIESRKQVGANQREDLLPLQARNWMTPKPADVEGGGHTTARPDAMATSLQIQSKNWLTAGSNDHKGTNKKGQRRKQLDEAAEQIFTHPDQTTAKHGDESSKSTRRLNHLFVGWLMNWLHPDATGCDFSAMASCHHKQLLASSLYTALSMHTSHHPPATPATNQQQPSTP